MIGSFLVMLREGFEATLLVAIVLAISGEDRAQGRFSGRLVRAGGCGSRFARCGWRALRDRERSEWHGWGPVQGWHDVDRRRFPYLHGALDETPVARRWPRVCVTALTMQSKKAGCSRSRRWFS